MRKVVVYILLILVAGTIGWLLNSLYNSPKTLQNPISQVKPRPLDKYTIENLAKTQIQPSKIEIGETVKEDKEFTSYLFSFSLDPTLSGKEKKKVTGIINIPSGNGPFPAVVMFRGYVDQEVYKTGDGSRRAAEFFAKNGLVSVAPDFLGYGGSDKEAENILESRFQTYITALTLLESMETIQQWDKENIFIWGHSNGGQIALTVLEITGKEIPTTLWAPVSKPFPYSILYYTDESEDRGKLIRRELAKFEETYDPNLYSLDLYLDKIQAPLQIHQGTADDAVPFVWSDSLAEKLNQLDKEIAYFKYPGADHNLNLSWGTVTARDLAFFNKHQK